MEFKYIFSLLSLFAAACMTCYASTFTSTPIPDDVFEFMKGRSYKIDDASCVSSIPRKSLRYLTLSYYDFNGVEQEGHMVCHEKIADMLCIIFTELFKIKYQINKMRIIDYYFDNEDVKSNSISVDEASMRDNNTSCFMWRTIRNTGKPSYHGLGLAVDINPLQNPCISHDNGKELVEPATAECYIDRNQDDKHMIRKGDKCYDLFTSYGFEWGGAWTKKDVVDYQHFQYSSKDSGWGINHMKENYKSTGDDLSAFISIASLLLIVTVAISYRKNKKQTY